MRKKKTAGLEDVEGENIGVHYANLSRPEEKIQRRVSIENDNIWSTKYYAKCNQKDT